MDSASSEKSCQVLSVLHNVNRLSFHIWLFELALSLSFVFFFFPFCIVSQVEECCRRLEWFGSHLVKILRLILNFCGIDSGEEGKERSYPKLRWSPSIVRKLLCSLSLIFKLKQMYRCSILSLYIGVQLLISSTIYLMNSCLFFYLLWQWRWPKLLRKHLCVS